MGKKYLFRALNRYDLTFYNNQEDIYCNKVVNKIKMFFKSYPKVSLRLMCKLNGPLKELYWNYIDDIYSHVGGAGLNDSSLISLSSDFDFVATEYAIPQAGKYNKCLERKPIALVCVDDSNIISDADTLKGLRNEAASKNLYIDLSNKRIEKYAEKAAIWTKDPTLLSYDNNNNIYCNIPEGLSNFASKANEYVAINNIEYNEVEVLIYPIMQDILYGLENSISADKIKSFITAIEPHVKNYLNNTCDFFLKSLYNNYNSGANLTDILLNNYNLIPGKTIEDKYNLLKEKKKAYLNELLAYINQNVPLSNYIANNIYSNKLTINRVVDDKIYVANFNNIDKSHFSKAGLNDILLIEYDGTVFKYNPSKNQYETALSSISYDTIKKHCGYKK